jgi:hypothetical protein
MASQFGWKAALAVVINASADDALCAAQRCTVERNSAGTLALQSSA